MGVCASELTDANLNIRETLCIDRVVSSLRRDSELRRRDLGRMDRLLSYKRETSERKARIV